MRLSKFALRTGMATMIATGAFAATGGAANAYIGQEVPIPGLHGCASGSGSLTSHTSSLSKGRITLSNSCSGRKYYVQIRLSIANSPDFASWQKVGAEISGAGTATFSWSDSHSSVYNGVGFRICQEKAFQTDPCGSPSSTIKR